jgi:DNA-binding FadR family transcriptional regulator
MSVSFELKPGERLNEGEPAKRLGVSRTPLREALNRLNTEGFLRFTPGKGFFCRELRPGAAYWPAPRHHHLGDQGRLRSHLHALGEVRCKGNCAVGGGTNAPM